MSRPSRSFLLICCIAAGSSVGAYPAEAIPETLAATYKLTNRSSTATCFVVTRPDADDTRRQELILVTAAHVLEKMSGDECRIVLRARGEDGSFVREEVPLKIRSANRSLWIKHPQVDVAALKLTLPAGRTLDALNLERLAREPAIETGKLHSAKEVWIPCYPAQLEANSAGFPILRRGAVASFPLTPIRRFRTYLVDYRTFGGDSGAPVMMRDRETPAKVTDRPLVVGLVIGQHRETTRSVTPVEERTVHRPLELAIVVHAEFIRQTIDRVPR